MPWKHYIIENIKKHYYRQTHPELEKEPFKSEWEKLYKFWSKMLNSFK